MTNEKLTVAFLIKLYEFILLFESEFDKFGKFNVSIDECKQRDELVLKIAYDNKIPITIAMGGGYSPDIKTIVNAHANTFRLAQEIFF